MVVTLISGRRSSDHRQRFSWRADGTGTIFWTRHGARCAHSQNGSGRPCQRSSTKEIGSRVDQFSGETGRKEEIRCSVRSAATSRRKACRGQGMVNVDFLSVAMCVFTRPTWRNEHMCWKYSWCWRQISNYARNISVKGSHYLKFKKALSTISNREGSSFYYWAMVLLHYEAKTGHAM